MNLGSLLDDTTRTPLPYAPIMSVPLLTTRGDIVKQGHPIEPSGCSRQGFSSTVKVVDLEGPGHENQEAFRFFCGIAPTVVI